MLKTGIFGGTFDPFHLGHLAVAKAFIQQMALDELFIIPAANTPLKHSFLFSFEQRLKMAELALADLPQAIISDMDATGSQKSYTIELISRFLQKYPQREIYFAIGEDNVAQLKEWKDYKQLLNMVKFVVFTRNTNNRDEWTQLDYMDQLLFQKMPPIDISATEIREKLINNEDVSLLLPRSIHPLIDDFKQSDAFKHFLLDQKRIINNDNKKHKLED
ncbi:MAG: nicotinate (nicotinamide) nucleotide adenylyltransferase [Candidatus Cloacimonadales bacterium]|jgi:nicotinate-nucleotide adenylyltransferase|nr:nicotinate (nicotinamide) nucleotide adenylyltransferase [Candidatus Cloacimonadales bacterium]